MIYRFVTEDLVQLLQDFPALTIVQSRQVPFKHRMIESLFPQLFSVIIYLKQNDNTAFTKASGASACTQCPALGIVTISPSGN